MSKKLFTILLSVVAACAFAFAAACTPVVNPPEEPTEEAQLTLSLSSVQLERLEEVTLTAKYDDEIITGVEWKSNDNSIATVVNGLVNAVGEGSTVIIATYEELEARCLVVVTDNGLVPGITTNVGLGDKLYLINGDEFTVEYEITYNNKVINDAQVTLTLPQNDYADLEGNVLKPKAVGDCGTLTISATWKGLTDTVYVDVSVLPNASAKLVDQPLLTLYNDSRAGATSKALTPKFIVNDVELSLILYKLTELVKLVRFVVYYHGSSRRADLEIKPVFKYAPEYTPRHMCDEEYQDRQGISVVCISNGTAGGGFADFCRKISI